MSDERRLEPGAGPVLGDFPPPPRRAWTIMLFLAGDNNLEDFGRRDLAEIKEIGSTGEVALVAQFDRMSEANARRYYLRRDTTLEDDVVDESLGSINTGDPRALAQFLYWGIDEYPAERYALIVWNHGSGWKEEDIYRLAGRAGLSTSRRPNLDCLVQTIAERTERPPLFASSIGSVLASGIAYDDTATDFLDNAELRDAIRSALMVTGTEKLALLGFDACLMSMLEVAYQLRGEADFMVASQETEPGDGWPYAPILAALVQQPQMSTADLATIIVEEYIDSYGPADPTTQSALDLAHIYEVVQALDGLCDEIIAHPDEYRSLVYQVVKRAQRFSDPEYKDLYDFCSRLYYHNNSTSELRRLAQEVMLLLAPPGMGRFVIAEGHGGYGLSNVHGLSIYFPEQELSKFYGRLEFAIESRWDDMLRMFFLGS